MNRWSLTACAIAPLLLGSCSLFRAKKEPQPAGQAEKADEKARTEKREAPTVADSSLEPTAEQQLAAHKLLKEEASVETAPEQLEEEPQAPQTANTSGIPGRSGLRLGNFAPPEEAASANENEAPAPNSVEMHGLRSPSLPSTLPMDINGKLTPAEEAH